MAPKGSGPKGSPFVWRSPAANSASSTAHALKINAIICKTSKNSSLTDKLIVAVDLNGCGVDDGSAKHYVGLVNLANPSLLLH